MNNKNQRPKENRKNSIVMVCSECGCYYVASREDYEKKGKLKRAIWLFDLCSWCQQPGNFYDDCQEYYDEDGMITDVAE